MFLLFVPAGILISTLLVVPIAILFRYSLNAYSLTEFMIETVTASNYLSIFSDPYYRGIIFTTLRVSFVSTLVAAAVSFPAAYTLARSEGAKKNLLTLILYLPLLVGSVVRAAGWMALLGNTGILSSALHWLGRSAPLNIMYSEKAVYIGSITMILPYLILTVAAILESVPVSLEEAAQNLGGAPFVVFRRVLLPLALPGVIAGCSFAFIICMNSYATPLLMGGVQFKMMGPAVYTQFVQAGNWPFGAALAFVLFFVTIALVALAGLLFNKRHKTAPL